MVFPQAMFPAGDIRGAEWLLPLVIFGIAGADVALAALAYRHDVASTVHVRAIVEPWMISIAAGALVFTVVQRDGLIIAYVISVVAGLAIAFWRLFRSYGVPRGWRPDIRRDLTRWRGATIPLAAADAIEWGSRRLDIAILGLFVAPYWVGIYYVAQQVASLPQKLKTSFDPILAPVITQKLAEGDKPAVARQVRQVGFWIIAAQTGIALALGIPGEAVMGLVGPQFVGGTGALGFPARGRGGGGDGGRLGGGAGLCRAPPQSADLDADDRRPGGCSRSRSSSGSMSSAGPRIRCAARPSRRRARRSALMLALGLASILKARLLARLLGAPVQGWRWSLIWAAAAAISVGAAFAALPHRFEWSRAGPRHAADPARLRLVVWRRGFTRRTARCSACDGPEEPTLPPPGSSGA